MGIDDLVNQGKAFLGQNKDKIDAALHSEQAEGVSDSAWDAASEAAKKIVPAEHVDNLRESIDKSIVN